MASQWWVLLTLVVLLTRLGAGGDAAVLGRRLVRGAAPPVVSAPA